MRPSVRPITASSTSGTRATSASPSTTPMTILTSTIAWCTPCVELALRAHSVSHLTAQVLSLFTFIHGHQHGAPSLTRFSLSTSTCSSLSFLLLPPLGAVLRARQPDRHGKPVLLRQQGGWGRREKKKPAQGGNRTLLTATVLSLYSSGCTTVIVTDSWRCGTHSAHLRRDLEHPPSARVLFHCYRRQGDWLGCHWEGQR